MIGIVIDSEFESLIPALAPDAFALLETSIIAEGCRDALVVWLDLDGFILVDGHHRYKICTEHGIEYETVEYEFDDRTEVQKWIYDNQLGRRNLTDEYRTYILGARYELEKQQHGGDRKSTYTDCTLNTRERLASDHHICQQTVMNAAKYKRAVDIIGGHDDNVKDSILRGETGATKKDIMQYGAVQRDNPELGKLAVDELLAGNVKNFRHAIYNGSRQVSGKPSTTIAIDATDMAKAAQTIRAELTPEQIIELVAELTN